MRRTALIAAALLASHGAVLWLGRHSPVSARTTLATPHSVAPPEKTTTALTAFLRDASRASEDGGLELSAYEDEATQLAKAKAAIPANADLAAIVKTAAADPDDCASIETRAAFGLWVDRDPVAALRWLVEWARDASCPWLLKGEFTRHLNEGGLAKLGLYLREVPAARDFLASEATTEASDACFGPSRVPSSKFDSGQILQAAATMASSADRLELLKLHFDDPEKCSTHLAQLRALLDDRGAAAFLGAMSQERGPLPDGLLEELEHAGFPPHAVQQFAADHAQPVAEFAQTRTNADFIGTVANTSIPGVPAATATNVTDIVTGGLRSGGLPGGDGAITRNNIDAVLNNPNRSAAAPVPLADQIRGDLSSVSTASLMDLPGYAESREDFLRGKITGEEWVTRLQGGISGAADLHDQLVALAFNATVVEDPRRALGFVSESQPYLGSGMPIRDVSPEVQLTMASHSHELFAMMLGSWPSPLGQEVVQWANDDPASFSNFVAELPEGLTKDTLQFINMNAEAGE